MIKNKNKFIKEIIFLDFFFHLATLKDSNLDEEEIKSLIKSSGDDLIIDLITKWVLIKNETKRN
jgi:hypothetical protein